MIKMENVGDVEALKEKAYTALIRLLEDQYGVEIDCVITKPEEKKNEYARDN